MLISMLTGVLALAVFAGAVVCWVMVLTKVFKENVGLGVIGLLFAPFAYIYGWVKVSSYRLLRVMVIWTVCGALMLLSLLGMLLPSTARATPFLFTRNLEMAVLDGAVDLRLIDVAPYGTKGAVVVTRGGATMVLTREGLKEYAQSLDPAWVGNVLRP